VIYVYSIGEPAAMPPEPRPRGLGGARLRVLDCNGLAAVFSRHRTLQPQPSPKALWSHEAVVEQLMARGAVLPLRFGTVLDGEPSLRETLAERHEELTRGLENVRGRVELGLRVLGEPPRERPQGPGSGHAYLMARHQDHRRAQEAARDVHEPLAAMAHDARVRTTVPPPAILAAAYLVDRHQIDAFKARAGALAAARDDVSTVCTGPWPPYSFVPDQQP
jgi:Gas vesicle synthesis protein GvpL/GvpF